MSHGLASGEIQPSPLILPNDRVASIVRTGDTSLPPMLWIPGCGSNPDDCARILTRMGELATDRHFVSPWWPGEGGSTPLRSNETYTSRAEDVLAALHVESDGSWVAGWSAGGGIAARMAAHNNTLRAATICTPGVHWPDAMRLAHGLLMSKLQYFGSAALGNMFDLTQMRHTRKLVAINNELESFPPRELEALRDSGRWVAAFGTEDIAVPATKDDKAAANYVPLDHRNHYSAVLSRTPAENDERARVILKLVGCKIIEPLSTAAAA